MKDKIKEKLLKEIPKRCYENRYRTQLYENSLLYHNYKKVVEKIIEETSKAVRDEYEKYLEDYKQEQREELEKENKKQ